MAEREWLRCLPKDAADAARGAKETLTELRLRADRPAQLCSAEGDRFLDAPISAQELREIAVRLMEHSYYAREDELAQGFFTLSEGSRAGVSGTYVSRGGEVLSLREIGSLCIRFAREMPGCAQKLTQLIAPDANLRSALVVSPPGLGKTTMLRDAARLLSEAGWNVGIADERHELAACLRGVPTLNVGPRTDVADGCPKAQGMERLLRSMAPDVLITDELGPEDVKAVSLALHRGVAVLASCHARTADEVLRGFAGPLLGEGGFERIVLLGGAPGHIAEWRDLSGEAGKCADD